LILHLPESAPLVARLAADAALVAHIGGASLGLVAGSVSILARKGGRLHRFSGNVFFGAMLSMGAAAAVTAPLLPDRFSAVMGVFVVYLVLTAWLAVRPPSHEARGLQAAALLLAVGVAGADLMLGLMGAQDPHGLVDDQPSALGFIFAALAALAASTDVRVMRRGGLAGAPRLRRHLWRMSAALAIAWGSFAGQPKAQPEALKGSPLLAVPALITLALLLFWLVRTRSRRTARPAAGLAPAQEALS
jgi:uncharacterized membrane protein